MSIKLLLRGNPQVLPIIAYNKLYYQTHELHTYFGYVRESPCSAHLQHAINRSHIFRSTIAYVYIQLIPSFHRTAHYQKLASPMYYLSIQFMHMLLYHLADTPIPLHRL